MMRSAVGTALAIAIALGACKSNGGTGNGTGGGTASTVRCEDIALHVETLYKADADAQLAELAQKGKPVADDQRAAWIAEAVADNTGMVMVDCATDPAKVVPCARQAKTAADLEARCLIPLDEEGREGEGL